MGIRLIGITNSMLDSMTFESFNSSGASNASHDEQVSLQIASATAREFAEEPKNWLCLHGPTGVGKTHLAVAIANYRDRQGTEFRFCRVNNLLNRIRSTFASGRRSTYFERFDLLRNAELLILDDLVQIYMTDWEIKTLYELITHRYDARLPTVITTQYILWDRSDNSYWHNIDANPLWVSIRSRLNDSSVVTERLMAAPDYRNRGA